jgi:hypothetical protein
MSDSFEGCVSIHESWEDISREEQWAKINIDRDRCTLRRIVSNNHRTTAAQVTGQQN